MPSLSTLYSATVMESSLLKKMFFPFILLIDFDINLKHFIEWIAIVNCTKGFFRKINPITVATNLWTNSRVLWNMHTVMFFFVFVWYIWSINIYWILTTNRLTKTNVSTYGVNNVEQHWIIITYGKNYLSWNLERHTCAGYLVKSTRSNSNLIAVKWLATNLYFRHIWITH